MFFSFVNRIFSILSILSLAPGIFDHLVAVPAPYRELGEDHKSHFICFNLTEFLYLTFQFDKYYNKLKSKRSKPLTSLLRRTTHF